ncbi:MAG: MBL fold metallo-hydrolase [Acidobacteria bacterium]|nr:MBL fold metallo-hydrolase [Acidobacteriota bacterium]
MLFRQIMDPSLAQYAYLIGCQQTREAVIVDPERDIDRYLEIAEAEGLTITAVTETHIHADFLSGAREFAERTRAKLYLSDEGDSDWKYGWADGHGYDTTLLKNGDTFQVGNIELKALHTPGHTPEHLSFLVTDHGGGASEPMGILSGDFVFVGDLGRPDLLESAAGVIGAREPSAHRLHESVQQFLELPDFLQVWPAHGAGSACGKALGAVPMSTVGYERRFNAAIDAASRGEEQFVQAILDGQPEPPLYFARMKSLNRSGPPVLGELPTPRHLSTEELERASGRVDAVVVDTRTDRKRFMKAHLPRSLYAPLGKSFPTVVGSYVDPKEDIILVIAPDRVDEAVRNLIRIGLDRIGGFIVPDELSQAGSLVSTKIVSFDELEELASNDLTVLDVRGAAEFARRRIPEAINIAHTRLRAQHHEVPSQGPIYVHCQGGARAAVAAAFLERMGHEVLFIDDLFSNWQAAAGAPG